MNRVSDFIIAHSKVIIIFVILITIVMSYFASQIQIEADIQDMFPADDPAVKEFNQVNNLFGGMNLAIVMLEVDINSAGTILNDASLQKIDNLTNEFENIEGVQEVISLTNVQQIKGSLFGIEVSKLIEEIPETKPDIQQLKNELREEELYLGSIISEDFMATSIVIKFNPDLKDPKQAIDTIKSIAEQYKGPERLYFAGNPIAVNDVKDTMKKDILKLLPFILFIVVFILWISFRNISAVLLSISSVLISIIWTIGGFVLCQRPLSLVCVVLPVLLVSVGSAYAIHIVARYFEEIKEGIGVEAAVRNTINKVGIAVLFAGITTIVGFGSLIFSDLIIIKEFALGVVFGIGVALVISIIFIPAVFLHLPNLRKNLSSVNKKSIISNFLNGVFNIVSKKRHLIIIPIVFISIISIWAIPRLTPETGYLNYFKEDSSTRIAANLVDERFGGSATLDLVIYGDIKDPTLLKKMRDFQDEATKIEGLNHPMSMVTLFRTENKALNGDDPSQKVIPTNRKQIAQYLLLLTMSGSQNVDDYITFDESVSRIQFFMENVSTTETQNILFSIEKLIDKHFGNDYKVGLTGMPVLVSNLSKMVIRSQIQSIIASIVMTLVITSLLLKSLKRGLFSTITIAITVLINFGLMGWLNIPLDIATAMIASISVGIGVDYSIHIYSRFLEEKESKASQLDALKISLKHVGRANLYNALAVVAGFCVLLFSSFPPLVNFGGLTAITMIFSFLNAILLLPIFILLTIKILERKRLKTYKQIERRN